MSHPLGKSGNGGVEILGDFGIWGLHIQSRPREAPNSLRFPPLLFIKDGKHESWDLGWVGVLHFRAMFQIERNSLFPEYNENVLTLLLLVM